MISDATILARRFGYGPAGAQAADAASLLAGLARADRMQAAMPLPGRDEVVALGEALVAARKARQGDKSEAAVEAQKAALRALNDVRDAALRVAIARIVETEVPLRERLAWFWADHFTVRSKNAPDIGLPVDFVEAAIRPHIGGRFGEMLKAAETHPAMLVYLDQTRSVGPGSPAARNGRLGLNENLAREILELHTLGAGADYTQTDVREFAELLTGLTARGGGTFRPNMAEPGAETVLGARYGGGEAKIEDILQALDDLALHPATAQHVSRKLAVHFVADHPPDDLVAAMAAAWADSGGDLMAVYAVLMDHPAARAAEAQKARPPFEFLAASFRALEFTGAELMALPPRIIRRSVVRPLQLMGQPFLQPGGPDGWPEEASAWLTPQGIAARIVWAMKMPGELRRRDLPDPRVFAVTALGEGSDPLVHRAAAVAPSRPEAIGLVLASPGFNMR